MLSFAALMLFTRLLTPAEFGRYALVLAGVSLVHVVVFQWLQLVLARFLPGHQDTPQVVLQPMLALFLLLAVVVSGAGIILVLLWPDPIWQSLIVLAIPLTIAQGWLQINLTLVSTQLTPAKYGYLLGSKSLFALLIGGVLVWFDWGAHGPLLGLLLGSVAACLMFGRDVWRGSRPHWPNPYLLRDYSAYGLPLAITFALGWVISSSDRLLISWFSNDADAGVYSAGYDLAQQSLGLLLAIVNTAAYPLVMRQLEQHGKSAANVQLKRNGELIITLALTGAAGLIALAPALANAVVGEAFRADAIAVLPWIAAAAAVAGIKAYHLDVAFQLAQQSRWQAYTSIVAALVNVLLNLLLIPRFGILGAAWATLAAFVLAAMVSGWLGGRVFNMPLILPLLVRGLAVAALAYFGAWLIMMAALPSFACLILGSASGGALALAGAFLLDVASIRRSLAARVRVFLHN